ncbi:MAG: hypothetical protein COZ85_03300 [Candidatus Moranbacteria bacterium CG_4_8_14_3_um_filter_34_16]|nr:MAG: hypothetical protein COT31_02270 [Candidatus Moranbacteria bacterium CG08_land_8_20_14_0_20_34_16]PIW94792.1 MAG: hypothetical protein COZ85_03300 [Candidatus Moranbacteria bacterium CG_4_8_14_3_um_filter_34_16]PJA89085.1 MAG: hypothetical protein CO138_02385 [Candidatus Moranbacteria bacterium CG_4_9_14_3_um_filter_33_15]
MVVSVFVKIVRDLALAKKLDWTSFRERRIWETGKKFEAKEIDLRQAIDAIKAELKSYNITIDDERYLKEKMR